MKTLLTERFPELAPRYAELSGWHPDPGTHLVYAHVFTSAMIELLQSGRDAERMFAFVEELAASPDGQVKDLVTHAVLEPLVGADLLKTCFTSMGSQTRRLVESIVKGSK